MVTIRSLAYPMRLTSDQFAPFVTLCILCFFLLTGCTSKDIYHNKNFNPTVYFGTHVVRPGETLYSISWRYGRDLHELARANNISTPYTIFPGQKISLEKSKVLKNSSKKTKKNVARSKTAVTKRKGDNEKRTKVTNLKKQPGAKGIEWQWPHLGPILAKYNTSASAIARNGVNKGIDISGKLGDPVLAAASGEVVYAGSGLLGYGKLIIINHDVNFLSAYAHNKRILVKEGQQISKGQQIAEMGSTGTDRPMLHFEIRKNGNPVNPTQYLPKKRK